MDQILDRFIKELMEAYPGIVTIVEKFKIGCSSCSVGTCKLRDIIEIHALSESDEQALFKQIAHVVFPGQTVAIPRLPRKYSKNKNTKKLSPPIQILVKEHVNIKKVIQGIPTLIEHARTDLESAKKDILTALEFIRNYADKFHHAKEEDLLFKLFDEKSDIIAIMYSEHETGRAYVRATAAAIETKDVSAVAENLLAYGDLLTEHIRKEDEILYPFLDRSLTDSQVGVLYAQFADVENSFGDEPNRLVSYADSLVVYNN